MKLLSIVSAIAVLLAVNVQAQTFTNYTEADDLVNNGVNALAEDANGVIWMATEGGISEFNPATSGWVSYNTTTTPDLLDDIITAVATISNGDVWFGTDFGISVYDGTNWTSFTGTDGLGSERIRYIKEGPKGNIWVGESNGLSVYDGTTWTSYGTNEGIPFGGITHIDFDPDNDNAWLGTGLSGVLIYDGADFIPFGKQVGLISDKVTAVEFAPNGERWIGTSNGISVFNTDNVLMKNHTRMYIMPPPDTLNPVEAIAFDANGVPWVGIYVDYLVTVGGIAVYEGLMWEDYDQTDGLVGPAVRDVIASSDGTIWVATSTGVTRIGDVNTSIDKDLESSFKLYPNPATDYLHLELEDALNTVTTISVFNTQMQEVLSASLQAQQSRIKLHVGTMSPGVYFVKVGERMGKVVVK